MSVLYVRRGKGKDNWGHNITNDIFIFSGYCYNGKRKNSLVTLCYKLFKKYTGIKLAPGEVKKIEIKEIE